MKMTPSHEEIESLLGAFALDAAEPEELAMVEAHLSECPRCRAEVDGLHEVAGALGNAAVPLPSHLWDRISEQLGDPPVAQDHLPPLIAGTRRVQESALMRAAATASAAGPTTAAAAAAHAHAHAAPIADLASHRKTRGVTSRSLRWSNAVLGVAAVAIIAVLAVNLSSADNRLNSHQGTHTVSAVSAALATPGHTVVDLRTAEGAEAAKLVLVPDGRGYMYDAHMAALPMDETYQLWGLIDRQPISLALLGSDPKQAGITVAAANPTQLMVTVEPLGGVTTPDRLPVATGNVTAA